MPIFDIREPSLEALKAAPVYFRYGSNKNRVLVDTYTASAILAIHGAANEPNRAKLERMVAGTPSQFTRLATFCFAHVK